MRKVIEIEGTVMQDKKTEGWYIKTDTKEIPAGDLLQGLDLTLGKEEEVFLEGERIKITVERSSIPGEVKQ